MKTQLNLNLMGYSERGIINSFFYETFYNNNQKALKNLLSMISFPKDQDQGKSNKFVDDNFKVENIFIEQSFSDFGTSDVVLLVSNGKQKESIFIEAKVAAGQKNKDLNKYFDELDRLIKNRKKSITSNLFCQLYLKQRLFDMAGKNERTVFTNGFLDKKNGRQIGKNIVVNKVFKELKQYSDKAYYIAIVPGTPKINLQFINSIFSNEPVWKDIYNFFDKNFPYDMNEWGFIFWSDIYEKLLKSNKFKLNNSLQVFEWNASQILTSEECRKYNL